MRNPNISICELYGNLREDKARSHHPGLLYSVFIRPGLRKKSEYTKKKSHHLSKYDTPERFDEMWQMGVKYFSNACYAGKDGGKFCQYIMIDKASRERFIFPYKEQRGFSTVDFIKRAITCFGHAPKVIQTDNSSEFTNFNRTKRVHVFDKFCLENGIEHKLIRSCTP